jgi:hypothetical protein
MELVIAPVLSKKRAFCGRRTGAVLLRKIRGRAEPSNRWRELCARGRSERRFCVHHPTGQRREDLNG